MKYCKRSLAVVLCLCTIFSALAFSVSGETITIWRVPVDVTSAKATAFKDGDPETVTRLELTIERVMNPDGTSPAGSFEIVDTNAVINIYDGLYVNMYETISAITQNDAADIYETARIATARPVSFENGVLTVDVFSLNGACGAKMVSVKLDAFESNIGSFIFELPRDLLCSADGLLYNNNETAVVAVDGLQVRTLELPSLVKSIFTDFVTGNYLGLLGKALFILPLSFIILPLLMNKTEKSAQKIYDLYGISVHQLFDDAQKAVRKIIPYLIGQIF